MNTIFYNNYYNPKIETGRIVDIDKLYEGNLYLIYCLNNISCGRLI